MDLSAGKTDNGTAGRRAARGEARGRCARCEELPENVLEPGTLFLWPPLGHSLAKARSGLRSGGWSPDSSGGRLEVDLEEGRLGELLSFLSRVFTAREQEDTLALFKPAGDALSVSDIPRTQPLKKLSALEASGWLLDLLAEGRLTSHFQPIVRAGAPAEVYAQECLLRGVGEDGVPVFPTDIFEAARTSGLLFQTDLAARLTAIREAVRHGVASSLFINFTPTALYDPRFCLRSTVEAVDEAGIPHEKIVFEVTETEETSDAGHLKEIVDYYRETGFRVALDDLGSGYSSLNLVHLLRPDFIKLDLQLVRGVDRDPYKAIVAGKLLEMAQSLGVETIAEGVETPEELAWAREKGASFVQGYLIARPSSPPVRDLRPADAPGAGREGPQEP